MGLTPSTVNLAAANKQSASSVTCRLNHTVEFVLRQSNSGTDVRKQNSSKVKRRLVAWHTHIDSVVQKLRATVNCMCNKLYGAESLRS
jgi:hypothetical protein